jgi:molecular chaperone DnaJ
MLGGRIRIPTIDGDVDVKVPSGAQPGDNIALRGRGIQRLRSSARGDQIVTLKVEFPRSLRGKQKEIIEEYASLVDEEYRPKEEPTQVKPDTPPPSPKMTPDDSTFNADNSTTKDDINSPSSDDDKEGGFFKNAFGKLKGKICHEEENKDKNKDDNDEKK